MNQVNLNATATREIIRSTFNPPHPFEHTFTCNTGDVIPLFCYPDILPHDTWKFKVNIMVRQQTPLHPTIGRAYWMRIAYYTPHSQVWDNWNGLRGEVKDAAWKSQTQYFVPKMNIGNDAIDFKSFWDHAGIRPTLKNCKIGVLALRHYLHICNEWLRDQNVEAPIEFSHGDEDLNYVSRENGGTFLVGADTYKINRKADYFSTALPEPQRGESVALPLYKENELPIVSNTAFKLTTAEDGTGHNLWQLSATNKQGQANLNYGGSDPQSNQPLIYENGLKVDISNVTAADINDFRSAARVQQIYELDARAGSRAPETLWARWGVEVDELELNRPRMLCADQGLISIFQVEQTSATTQDSPQGNLAAFGMARSESEWNTHSFKYDGCLMILFWIRTEHKYQYGVPRWATRFSRFDFWHPEFDGEGDQPIYKHEIFATGENITNMEIFGYAERGADYKMFPNLISGELRSDYPLTLDSWTYADKYNSAPTLSNEWMKESPENVDRTITVQSSIADQWLVDSSIELEITRAMRVHSIPGIDRV